MIDIYSYSTIELIRMLGSNFRDYRIRLQKTQQEVADESGLSVMTVQRFENGQSKDVSMSTLIRLMRTVGCLDDIRSIFPPLDESAYMYRQEEKPIKRIRHKS